ncbi:MAG: alpha/beta hydrolase, partial [Pseudomonadota bacterium]
MPKAVSTRTSAPRLGLVGLLSLLLATGCERAVLGFVNRGVPPPEASVVYAADRGLSLDVYRPTVAKAGGAPVVVFFYGGSWQRGSRTQYRFVGQRLAENGILAIVADYRTWPQAGFPDFIDDAARAVRWTFDNAQAWGGDPDRVFVAGHSAGAQLAALVATDPRYLGKYGLAR